MGTFHLLIDMEHSTFVYVCVWMCHRESVCVCVRGSLTWHRLNLGMVICHTLLYTPHALSFKEYAKKVRILKFRSGCITQGWMQSHLQMFNNCMSSLSNRTIKSNATGLECSSTFLKVRERTTQAHNHE